MNFFFLNFRDCFLYALLLFAFTKQLFEVMEKHSKLKMSACSYVTTYCLSIIRSSPLIRLLAGQQGFLERRQVTITASSVCCLHLTLQLSYSQSLNNVYRIPHFYIICRNNTHQTFALCNLNNS